jgi:hypothetical protein
MGEELVTPAIAESDPTQIVIGDSVKWLVADSDYPPADGWTMKYHLVSKDAPRVTWTGLTDNGDSRYLATLTTADTRGLTAGTWNWQRVATKGSEVLTRAFGTFDVVTGYGTTGAQEPFVDGRSWAQQQLDAVQAEILRRATGGAPISVSINGRSISREPMSALIQLRDDLMQQVEIETAGSQAGIGRQLRVRHVYG